MKIEERLAQVQKKLDNENLSDLDFNFFSGLELYYLQIIWQNSKKGEKND